MFFKGTDMPRALFSSVVSAVALCLTTTIKLAHDHKRHDHDHAHPAHGHDTKAAQKIYNGYFEVADRSLADRAGTWQSVSPYLQDGTLTPLMAAKAQEAI